MLRLWVILAVVGLLMAGGSVAQEVGGGGGGAAAGGATRVIRVWDFEERELGNAEDRPMFWERVRGTGLPHYLVGKFAKDQARSGGYSFRFDLDGGSLAYRYFQRDLTVTYGSTYRVQAYVKTTKLEHARARLSVNFADETGALLPRTAKHSAAVVSADALEGVAGNEWTLLTIDLVADDVLARYLAVDLELLQPGLLDGSSRPHLLRQDIQGSAWFDDVSVVQIPRVRMSTDRAVNVFERGARPKLNLLVTDQILTDLSMQLAVKDVAGRMVYQRSFALQETVAGTRTAQMSLVLPELSPGWYAVEVDLFQEDRSVSRHRLTMVCLADEAKRLAVDRRLALIATGLVPSQWVQLPDITRHFPAGQVKLAVWGEGVDIGKADSNAFDQLVERLQEDGVSPVAVLKHLPDDLAKTSGGRSLENLRRLEAQLWQIPLSIVLARHANHVSQWQLLADDSPVLADDAGMAESLGMMRRQFTPLVREADIAVPWPAWLAPPAGGGGVSSGAISVFFPETLLPDQLPLYAKEFSGATSGTVSVVLRPTDAGRTGYGAQWKDFTERFVSALSTSVSRVDVPMPVEFDSQGMAQPTPLFPVLRTLAGAVAGSSYAGRLSIGEGIEAHLFRRGEVGTLIFWSTVDTTSGPLRAEVHLGGRPVLLDLFGEAMEVPVTGGRVSVPAYEMPQILAGVDAELCLFRAAARLDRPLLESKFEPHTRKLVLTNTFEEPISGTVKLDAPEGWMVLPRVLNFSAAPGATVEREITLEFPYNYPAGDLQLMAKFSLPGMSTPDFEVPVPMRLGLSDIGTRTLGLRDGDFVVVQQMITNYSDKVANYLSFAVVKGQPRQERLVTDLPPGQTVMKRYRFASKSTDGPVEVRVGLKEIEGTRILNDSVRVP